ncbi:MAG: protein BatD [Bacteroidales bacterium]|nr:protein BatD [Bacteroidales bacterium]
MLIKKTAIPILLILCSYLLSGLVSGQDIEFRASASPRVLRAGEQFSLEYEINANVADLEIPGLTDFQLLGGPSTSSSTSIQIINGKTTRSVKYTYTYYLRALKEGTFTISPAKARYKGKAYESNSLTVEVIGSGASQQQSQTTPGQSQEKTPARQDIQAGEDVFVRLHVDKHSAYLGEQIIGWVKIYTKIQLSGLNQGYKGPEFTGFYKQPVEVPQLTNLEAENVNGEIYYTGIIQKFVLYPQKTGEITIDPFELGVTIRQQVRSRSRSIFDDFFGPTVQDIPRTLTSKAVKIRINPLPSKPQSFTGAVGNFSMQSSVDKNNLRTNEALTYKVTISGKGNVKLIDEPNVTFPPNIEQFEPKTVVHQINELSGTKTFEYVLIPRYAGEYKIPPFEFTYFDPAKGSFTTLMSEEYTVSVEKGDEDTTAVVVTGLSKEDFRLLGKDILFIKNKPFRLLRQGKIIFGQPYFYMVYGISFLLFLLIVILRRETIRRNANISQVRNRKANRLARKRLRKARTYLKLNNRDAFYEEVMKALWGYLSDKLTIPVARLSRDKSREILEKKQIDHDLVDSIYALLDNCEYARFAPSAGTSDMQNLYKDAVTLISKLEHKLK